MIPILYAAAETDFTHNGIGALSDASKCCVTEERNGAYELELEYPIFGVLYEKIREDCIIKAKPNETSVPQLFRIYSSSKPKSGFVCFFAEHISYELSLNPIEAATVTNQGAKAALDTVLSAALLEHNYEAQSDIETLNSIDLSRVSVRAALGGVDGSILDTYGGEYEFDNFVIRLHSHRGSNTGIKIAYGKNITDIKQDKNISRVYTAVYPFATRESDVSANLELEQIQEEQQEQPEKVVVTLPEKILYSPNALNYAKTRVLIKDFTDAFKENETINEATLRTKAQLWMNTSGFDVPSVSITVSFVNLWQSPEYEKFALLERVNLCDIVTVEYPKLGVTTEAKVIKTKYDTLNEKYISLELGNARANFADTVNQTTAAIDAAKQEIKSQATAANINLAQAIKKATNAITGHSGGYVVLNPANNPQEILIMDAPNIETAVNVWRWNSAGLGHSSNGYNGPFELAITADGSIVADFITSGTLKGELLESGSVKANALSVEYKNEVQSEIDASANAVRQEFEVADNSLKSSLTKTLRETVDQTSAELHEKITEQNTALTQTCEEIIMQALTTYTQTGDFETFKEATQAQLKLLSNQLELKFTQTQQGLEISNGELQEQLNNIAKYFTFDVNGLTIGQTDSPYKVIIDNDRYSMLVNGVEVMWIADGKVYTPEIEVSKGFKLLDYLIEKDSSGNVNCEYIG